MNFIPGGTSRPYLMPQALLIALCAAEIPASE
jgi:hypothetical protein